VYKSSDTRSVLVQRELPKERKSAGGIVLPEEFVQGTSGALSPDRYCEVVDSANPDFKKGDMLAVRETDHMPFPLIKEMEGRRISKVPIQFVVAKVKDGHIEPVDDYVLVKCDALEETIEGSFLIKADTHKKVHSDKATVVKVGTNVTDRVVGERVVISYGAGLMVNDAIHGETILLKETPRTGYSEDFLAVINEQ
jgi:co-chaperonin GroES (HSP10)